MGRKRIGQKIKRIIIHVGNESAFFELDEKEKLIMSKEKKNQLIKKMKKKINHVLSQKNDIEEIKDESLIAPFTPLPILTEQNEEDSITEIPVVQEEPKIITITIDRNNEKQCEDLFISQLSHLFQMNHEV